MSRDHSPGESERHDITVTCKMSGPESRYSDGTATVSTIADLEAFTSDLRRLGARDDTPVENAVDLKVTLDVRERR